MGCALGITYHRDRPERDPTDHVLMLATVTSHVPFLRKRLERACVGRGSVLAFSKTGPEGSFFTNPPIFCYTEVRIRSTKAHSVPYVWGWYFVLDFSGILPQRFNGSSQGEGEWDAMGTAHFSGAPPQRIYFTRSKVCPLANLRRVRVQKKGALWLTGTDKDTPSRAFCINPGSSRKESKGHPQGEQLRKFNEMTIYKMVGGVKGNQ